MAASSNINPKASEEIEELDVIVTLEATSAEQVTGLVPTLQAVGLAVVKVDEQNGVIEGTIDAQKLADLKRLPGVRYVRSEFEYMATPEQKNAKSKDGPPGNAAR